MESTNMLVQITRNQREEQEKEFQVLRELVSIKNNT